MYIHFKLGRKQNRAQIYISSYKFTTLNDIIPIVLYRGLLKMKFVFKVFGIVIFLSGCKVFGDLRSTESAILKSIFTGYDPNVLPAGSNNGTGPVEVAVNIYVRNLGEIDDTKMVYDAQLTFRQEWQDDRLKYDTAEDLDYVTVTRDGVIWVPDLFFSNEHSGNFHNIIKPNNLIRIYPDGRILYSTRISLKLFCQMDLQSYPMDFQVCKIIFASYAYTDTNLHFQWKNTNGIQVSKNLMVRKFQLNSFSIKDCHSQTSTGSYSCLMANFFLARNFHTFLKDVYIPTTSLVLLCWLVFWVNPKSSFIRFGIWIGTLITMYIHLISLSFKTPQTSYTKAIDIWTGSCLTFIYIVGIELCLVLRAVENAEFLIAKENKMGSKDLEEERNSGDNRIQKLLQRYCAVHLKWYNGSSKAQRIDFIFCVIYPLTFAIFTLIYWLVYSKNQDLCEGGGHCFIVKN